MGLNQDDPKHRFLHAIPAWSLPGVTVAVAAALALTGDPGRRLLRFERSGIEQGEVWRLVSGHFVHLGWSHFVLNAIGLLLILYLVGARFRPAQWLLIGVVTVAGIDLGFWLLEPQLGWYVGLSGLLHGLLAAGVVAGLRAGHREAWLLGIIVLAKVAYEQFVGPLPGSAASTGGNVIVAAHLYGALAGAAAGALLAVRVRRPRPI